MTELDHMAFVLHDGMKEIYAGIEAGDVSGVKRLLSEKPHLLHVETFLKPSWLHDAAATGNVDMVRMLLDLGLDINKADDKAHTSPLISAIHNGQAEVVRCLLTHGADPNVGRTLIAAVNNDDANVALQIVKLLVEHGADVNRAFLWYDDPKMPSFTALTWAEKSGKTIIADYLHSKGAVSPSAKPKKAPASREEEIVAHFEKKYGPVKPGALREVVPTGVPIAVHVVPPSKTHKQLTLFTTGMSDRPMTVPEDQEDYRYAELLIHLPVEWPVTKKSLADPKLNWPFRWLKEIARYPHDHKTWLGGPFTIIAKNPAKQIPGTGFNSVLLAAKADVHCADGRLIQLYTIVPLYPEERELELKQGLPALMRALDRQNITDVIDLSRFNAAAPPR